MTPLVDATKVAEWLGVDRYRVYELARTGVLPCVRLGKTMRFAPERVREFIEAGGTAASR
ncbi:hypothetical protein BH23GEM6_BH23GEM6_25930 [soil metagenome]